jgi:glycosyltransferase involved in cell wall biosynthesis
VTERVRVLRIIDRLNVGGPALQASVLTAGLDPARFEQRLVTGSVMSGEGDFVRIRAPDLPVTVVAGLGRAPRAGDDARAFATIVRAMREFRPHIVHTHKAKAGVLGRLAARVAGVPATVHTYHGHLLRGYFNPVTTHVVVVTERRLARRTTRLVAVGRQVRDDLVAAGIGRPEQFEVVAPGVDLPEAPDRDVARERLGLDGASHVVTFVGRLTPVKRPDRFVRLAARLRSRYPDAVFLVVGDGELLGATQGEARALGAHCCFLGWRRDVETVYAASDAVVITSDNEGMPVSLIEAARVGTPAVTTRVGSAPEVVADGITGFVTDPTVEALAAATAILLDDRALRCRFGAAARVRAAREFSGPRLVADTERIYEELAPRARRRACVPGS